MFFFDFFLQESSKPKPFPTNLNPKPISYPYPTNQLLTEALILSTNHKLFIFKIKSFFDFF